jgi:hypothetical protein
VEWAAVDEKGWVSWGAVYSDWEWDGDATVCTEGCAWGFVRKRLYIKEKLNFFLDLMIECEVAESWSFGGGM